VSNTTPFQSTLTEDQGKAVVVKVAREYTYLAALGNNSSSSEPIDVGRLERTTLPRNVEPGMVITLSDKRVAVGGSGGGYIERDLIELQKDLQWHAEHSEEDDVARHAQEALQHLERPVEFERKGRAVAEEYMEMVSDQGSSDCSTVDDIAEKHGLSVRETYRQLDDRVPDSMRLRKGDEDD